MSGFPFCLLMWTAYEILLFWDSVNSTYYFKYRNCNRIFSEEKSAKSVGKRFLNVSTFSEVMWCGLIFLFVMFKQLIWIDQYDFPMKTYLQIKFYIF